jgi:hypothetical protein
MRNYILITDATADTVYRLTGMDAHDTPLGALAEKPKPFNLDAELDKLDRAMHPNKPRCICGKWIVMHRPSCPFAYIGAT